MEELIKVATNAKGERIVSARELHSFLKLKTKIAEWLETQVKRAMLIENQDFTRVSYSLPSGQKANDIALTLSAAKEIAMLNGKEKGKQARLYFIECERKLNSEVVPTQLSPEEMFLMSAQIMVEQKKQIAEIKQEVKQLTEAVSELKVVNASIEYFTIMGYCRNIKKQISLEQAKVYGTKCRAMCNQLGFSMGKVPDPRFGTVNTYPLDVLNSIIN